MTTQSRRPGVPPFTTGEWEAACSWAEYLATVVDKREVWLSCTRRITVDEGARARLAALPGARRVLVLTEDRCGDAARSVPVLAAAFEASGGAVEHRYLCTDAHPALLCRYLTHGGRAIPIAIVEDERGGALGVWGPRPARLQAIFRAHVRAKGKATPETQGAWYAPILGWYGRDRGQSAIEEILMILERGGAPR